MRHAPLAAIIVLAAAGELASASQFQRGAVSSVTVEPGANDSAVVLTVRGSNPCRAISVDYGDGTADSHDIGSLPATFNHQYSSTGTYRVTVRGVTNCAGVATATVRASAATIGGNQGGTMRFRAMDRNGDGRISRQEWRGSDQSFRIHDWNGDGVLAGDEVRTGARRRDQDFGEEFTFNDFTERGFTTLDRDRNNRITSNEWLYDFDTFARVDRNGDDVLTRAEFMAADLGTTPDASRFDQMDINNNGRIDRVEWRGTRDAFDYLDRNNDGVLSRMELNAEATSDIDDFNSLDVNRDRVITRDEWQWSLTSFRDRDVNRDGRITRAEFLSSSPLDPTPGGAVAITVPGTQQWTDTGVMVRAGEILTFDATGTVYMTTGTDDAASPRGSQSGRRAAGSPLPGQPAGALVARVENSAPFYIGDRTGAIRMPRDGRLFLGVNDDYFGDNRGEFRVSISRVR